MSEIPVISIGETRVTLFALLAGLFFLAAAAAVTVRLRRREWKTGPAVLFCLAAAVAAHAAFARGTTYRFSAKDGDVIGRVNAERQRGSAVVAVDIPSGLNGLTGAAFDPCVNADCTVTFQFEKTGHHLGDGLDVCGRFSLSSPSAARATARIFLCRCSAGRRSASRTDLANGFCLSVFWKDCCCFSLRESSAGSGFAGPETRSSARWFSSPAS